MERDTGKGRPSDASKSARRGGRGCWRVYRAAWLEPGEDFPCQRRARPAHAQGAFGFARHATRRLAQRDSTSEARRETSTPKTRTGKRLRAFPSVTLAD